VGGVENVQAALSGVEDGGMRFTAIDDTAVDELQRLIEECSDYYEMTTGHPPGPAEAQSTYLVHAPGKAGHEDRLLLGLREAGEFIGLLDGVRDWPETGTWTIGLVLLAPRARGTGRASRMAAHVLDALRADGTAAVRAPVETVNRAAQSFVERLGFVRQEERDDGLVIYRREL
jgi:ribosomal protein S18 acetylase RimI-like enzyme